MAACGVAAVIMVKIMGLDGEKNTKGRWGHQPLVLVDFFNILGGYHPLKKIFRKKGLSSYHCGIISKQKFLTMLKWLLVPVFSML
jgi:hypothetical protein